MASCNEEDTPPTRDVTTNASSSAPSNGFPWEELAVEIRDHIFDMVDRDAEDLSCSPSYFKWQGSLPPLVVALRPLPVSYRHVLQRFAIHNSEITLCPSNGYDLSAMAQPEMDIIESINLQLG
jgi:hypothetical protein